MKVERKPQVIMTPEAYFRMMEYCRQAVGEVTGFGCVTEVGDTLFVDEIFIVPQRATAGGVHVDAKDLLDFMTYAKEQGRPDWITKSKLWWHSHADFGVFRSKTDNDTIEMFLGMQPYVLAIVGNHKGEYECSLHYQKPRVSFNNLRIKRNYYDTDAVRSDVYEDIRANVHEWKHEKKAVEPIIQTPEAPRVMENFSEEDYYNSRLFGVEERPVEKAPSQSFVDMSDEEWEQWKREHGA